MYSWRMPYKDPVKKKEYDKKHYHDHQQYYIEKSKAYRKNNRAKCNNDSKEYYHAHKEENYARIKAYRDADKDRQAVRTKKHYQMNKDKYHSTHLKRTYGITLDEYNQIFADQAGCCKICGVHQVELKKKLSVDHSHKTKQIRGLLCAKCNLTLGNMNDDPVLLVKAAQYLQAAENIL